MTQEQAQSLLAQCRTQIDGLDTQILALLNDRARIAESIGDAKAAAGLPVVELAREKAVIDRMVERNPGPLAGEAVSRIYQAIMLEMRRIQELRRS
jgi:chorismate mutase / prephenate dehydratase